MSWSANGLSEDGELEVSTTQVLTELHAEQIQVASKAVQTILKSGVLGDPNARYHVAMTGHANPDHEPVAGWSNDSLAISISQASREV